MWVIIELAIDNDYSYIGQVDVTSVVSIEHNKWAVVHEFCVYHLRW